MLSSVCYFFVEYPVMEVVLVEGIGGRSLRGAESLALRGW